MKPTLISPFVLVLFGAHAFAKPFAPGDILSRQEECPPRGSVVESCFMCKDKQWEDCGEPDEVTGQRICYCSDCKYACYLDLVGKREPIPTAAPEPEPEPATLPETKPEAQPICPPQTGVVEGCSKCKYGFTNKLGCRKGDTGLECRCDVCLNFCTYDGPTFRRSPGPEPEAQGSGQCSQLPVVQSCSKCPFGFFPTTCKPGSSGPRECTCTGCGYACQDDSVKASQKVDQLLKLDGLQLSNVVIIEES